MKTRSMEVRELSLPDLFLITPKKLPDVRGVFFESFREDVIRAELGRPFDVTQANFSVSRRGALRGVHSVRVSPGQAKLVSCVRGAVLDVVVDLRVGSPTFGRHEALWLDDQAGTGLFISEGLGHSFLALADDTCMHYQCSTTYAADTVVSVNALDPDLRLPWNLSAEAIMSDTDRAAPMLAEAADLGMLSSYEECLRQYGRALA